VIFLETNSGFVSSRFIITLQNKDDGGFSVMFQRGADVTYASATKEAADDWRAAYQRAYLDAR
jgi:hypothetical protein